MAVPPYQFQGEEEAVEDRLRSSSPEEEVGVEQLTSSCQEGEGLEVFLVHLGCSRGQVEGGAVPPRRGEEEGAAVEVTPSASSQRKEEGVGVPVEQPTSSCLEVQEASRERHWQEVLR